MALALAAQVPTAVHPAPQVRPRLRGRARGASSRLEGCGLSRAHCPAGGSRRCSLRPRPRNRRRRAARHPLARLPAPRCCRLRGCHLRSHRA
ncbi:hypothetical protein ACFPRL_25735 [Pseudoclavibacter helvolus]